MIDHLKGILTEKSPSRAVLDISGVAFSASISLSTYDALPSIGSNVTVWTLLQIRDDEPVLFAFASREERWLFQHLISVNGVGPRLAITILSGALPSTVRQSIIDGDADRLKSVRGIGSRTADRIVLELQKKLMSAAPQFVTAESPVSSIQEAIEALGSLGFSRTEAEKAVKSAAGQGAKEVEDLVKTALKAV